jgi:hypothetical protein
MGKLKSDNNAITLTKIAQGQSLAGKSLVIGQGLSRRETLNEPYRILDQVPVFYVGANEFDLPLPENPKGRLHKWGEYYHPYMLVGMPDVGGWNKIYVAGSVEGWYLMFVKTKLDEWAVGPSDWAIDMIAWTPKVKNDSLIKAGYRMFWASALALDNVPTDEYYSDDYDEDGTWLDTWECSTKCKEVFAAIRKTCYTNKREFKQVIDGAPEILREHIESRKLIKSKKRNITNL